ncbi:MAG: hypothetical protein H7336_06135 [Bacteriovorax sp.]|nr:hypothetical protein [Bacteriovorax sp.]
MEDTKKIINWSLENADLLSLKVEYYTGLRKIFPHIFDIGIFIEVEGKVSHGRGTDDFEEVAYAKALSEALERASINYFNIKNTNGLAVHFDIDSAKKNGREELLERDAFLCHFLLGKGFIERNPFNNKFNFEHLSNQNISIKFFEMCRYQDGVGILCIANGESFKRPFGNIFGSAFGDNEEIVFKKAYIEVLRLVMHIKDKEIVSINLAKFKELEKYNFSDHGKLSLDLEYSKKINSFINENVLDMTKEVQSEDFQYEILDLSLIPLPNLPLHIVWTRNFKLQNLFTGKSEETKINMKRLSQVSNCVIEFKNINSFPHPFD